MGDPKTKRVEALTSGSSGRDHAGVMVIECNGGSDAPA